MSGRLKIKLFGLITFINVAIGVTLGGLLYTIWPDHYFEWYPLGRNSITHVRIHSYVILLHLFNFGNIHYLFV